MIKNAILKLAESRSLSESEAAEAMKYIMDGEATQAQIGSFMMALRLKGETVEEITGCAKVMRDKSIKINPKVDFCIDTCGTGGDGSNTFNISTAAAIVTAAGGVCVAKHGNRSVSSRSGSADVLEALGVNISLEPSMVEKCIEQVGIGFLFAPLFHQSMKYAAGPRQELGIRTIFNVLGPLTNPANAAAQVMGVFSPELVETLARVLLLLGIKRALVINSEDGLDEISLSGRTKVAEVKDGDVNSFFITADELGLSPATIDQITGGSAQENAVIIMGILNGVKGPHRDIVIANSAAALYVAGKVESLKDGIQMAANIIDTGKATMKLEELKRFANGVVNNGLLA